jgi:chromosome segregation ATPase
MASPQASSAGRRRQRSTRLTVAVVLLALAALAVVGAVISGTWILMVLAAALGVVLGAAATRITHSELAETRREAARDRAEQARAYRDLTVARTAEHTAFAESMQERLSHQETAVHELEDALSAAQGRAAEATRKLNAEARRANAAETVGRETGERLEQAEQRAAEAIVRVVELEQELDVVRAELEIVTQAWHAAEATRRHA